MCLSGNIMIPPNLVFLEKKNNFIGYAWKTSNEKSFRLIFKFISMRINWFLSRNWTPKLRTSSDTGLMEV